MIGFESASAIAKSLGGIYPRLQPSRFERACRNLRDAYPDWDESQVRETAASSYQHLFRLGVELLYTPRFISFESLSRHIVISSSVGPSIREMLTHKPVLLITGHVGNWELLGYTISMMGFPMHAVYRPLDLRPLDRWVRDTRQRRGLTLVNKFGAVQALPDIVRGGQPVALVADQSGGDRGIFVPFFGRLTSTYKSIGMLALQTGATLVCGMARRMREDETPPPGSWSMCPGPPPDTRWKQGSLRYSVEAVDVFGPEDYLGRPDPLYYLTARYRRGIEAMVRQSPEQYFWMHRVWRSRPLHERTGKAFPEHLRRKMLELPWMSGGDVEAVVARSEADKGKLKELQR